MGEGTSGGLLEVILYVLQAMVPLASFRAMRACVPTMPLALGFIPHATHPEELPGLALNAKSTDPFAGK